MAASGSAACAMASISLPAVAGPMPGRLRR
ncbi:Uncharacterised protein [Bordetella pertussis]|nr:Uncharacterised protein [Bordetella pertussis]